MRSAHVILLVLSRSLKLNQARIECLYFIAEGSGDLLDTDVLIPKTRITESVDKSHIAFNETKKDVVILSKENVTIKGVTRTTDDEDILSKKPKPELTTTAMPTSTEPLFEDLSPNDTEDDDFTFTDWFGLLGDDPMAGGSSKNKLSEFPNIWTASSEFGTYSLCEQRRFRRACASAQSRQNLRCSLIQAVSQEEPSDRKPDPWPL